MDLQSSRWPARKGGAFPPTKLPAGMVSCQKAGRPGKVPAAVMATNPRPAACMTGARRASQACNQFTVPGQQAWLRHIWQKRGGAVGILPAAWSSEVQPNGVNWLHAFSAPSAHWHTAGLLICQGCASQLQRGALVGCQPTLPGTSRSGALPDVSSDGSAAPNSSSLTSPRHPILIPTEQQIRVE